MTEIIYVDDDATDRHLAVMAHRESGVGTSLRLFKSGQEFLDYVQQLPDHDPTPRAVLMDLNMPGKNGLEVLLQLQVLNVNRNLMVWMFSNSSRGNEHQLLKASGAARFLSKPTDYELTVSLFHELAQRLGEPMPAHRDHSLGLIQRILLVEDSEPEAKLFINEIQALSPKLEVLHASRLTMAESLLDTASVDGLILDLHLPDAVETEGLIRLVQKWPHLPIVAVSGRYNPSLGRQLIRKGAQDFLQKHRLDAASLLLTLEFAFERQRTLNQLRGDLKRSKVDALTDPLTALPNRRALLNMYHQLDFSDCNGNPERRGLMVVDVDRLKQVNDHLGHLKGDELIQLVAATLKSKLRLGDVLARIGGDEFVVLFNDLPAGDWGEVMIARMRQALAELPPLIHGEPISASFGFAEIPSTGAPFDAVFGAADARMYGDKALNRSGNGASPHPLLS